MLFTDWRANLMIESKCLRCSASLEREIRMPWKLPVGSGLGAKVYKIVSKSVDLVKVLLHLPITAVFFDFLFQSSIVFLQRHTNEQNHEKVEKFLAEHCDRDFDTALVWSDSSCLFYRNQNSHRINQQTKLIFRFGFKWLNSVLRWKNLMNRAAIEMLRGCLLWRNFFFLAFFFKQREKNFHKW